MAYSETRILIGGLAHVPILIVMANLIKGKFETKALEIKESEVKKEAVQVIEGLSNKLEEIEKKAEEVNKKMNKRKKRERKDMTRD